MLVKNYADYLSQFKAWKRPILIIDVNLTGDLAMYATEVMRLKSTRFVNRDETFYDVIQQALEQDAKPEYLYAKKEPDSQRDVDRKGTWIRSLNILSSIPVLLEGDDDGLTAVTLCKDAAERGRRELQVVEQSGRQFQRVIALPQDISPIFSTHSLIDLLDDFVVRKLVFETLPKDVEVCILDQLPNSFKDFETVFLQYVNYSDMIRSSWHRSSTVGSIFKANDLASASKYQRKIDDMRVQISARTSEHHFSLIPLAFTSFYDLFALEQGADDVRTKKEIAKMKKVALSII
jgi:hypothetical protein